MFTVSSASPRGKFHLTCHRRLSKCVSARNWGQRLATIRLSPQYRPTVPTWAGPLVATSPIPKWKYGFNLLAVLFILPLTLVLLPLLFCWIKLASPGPFMFKQTRIGRGGKPFTMYKIRTMSPGSGTDIHEAHVARLIKTNQPMCKLDHEDSRLIRGACFIRMSGLDELPQLINVLRGEMSVVGPRPCVQCELHFYDAKQSRRFSVQPGLTGLWQTERTQATTFSEMVAMDLKYVDHLSLGSDCKIIMKTPAALFMQLMTCARSRTLRSDHWMLRQFQPDSPHPPYLSNSTTHRPDR